MPALLVEIGTEDLPALEAGALAEAFRDLLLARLAEARIAHGPVKVLWTLRRLALLISEVAERQGELVEEVRGPTAAAGLDAEGRPTAAALGFLRRYGATPDRLQRRRVGDREYLFLRVETPGRLTRDLLPGVIAEAVRAIPCSKRMVWDDSGLSFLRPIRWFVLLLGDRPVWAELGHLTTSPGETHGHRFLVKKKVEIADPSSYVEALRGASVLVDPAEREAQIRGEIRKVEEEHQVQAVLDPELVARLVGSVEWPVAVVGTIPPQYLCLPNAVVVAALREEGKFVPFVRGDALAPVFLGFAEGVGGALVQQGYEQVVGIRLRDATLFFEQDRKMKLADRVGALKHVVQEARLGSVWERTERIRAFCQRIAAELGVAGEALDRAAFLSKADLTTVMVREFPELEGRIGGIYARLDGEREEVARAVEEHVLPTARGDDLPETPLGAALSLADKLDFVAGAVLIGELPSGSRDPYGIRRRAGAVVRLVLEKRLRLDLFSLLDATADLYPEIPGGGSHDQVKKFLLDRLRTALLERGLPYDVVDAVLALPRGDFLGALERAEALAELRGTEELSALAVALSRVRNITKNHKERTFDARWFTDAAEWDLWRAYVKSEGTVRGALERRDYRRALAVLLELKAPIDRYFDEVLVMCEDGRVRENRLGFLGTVADLFLEVGDLGRLVIG